MDPCLRGSQAVFMSTMHQLVPSKTDDSPQPPRGFHSMMVRGSSNFVYSGNNIKVTDHETVNQAVFDEPSATRIHDILGCLIHFRAAITFFA